MKKRLTAILLTLALVLSLGPVSVWAAGGSGLSPDDPMAVPEDGMVINSGTYYGISKEWFQKENPDGKLMYFSITIPGSVTQIAQYGFTDQWNSEKQRLKVVTNYNYDGDKTYTDKYKVVEIDFSQATSLTTIKSQAAMGAPLTGVLDLSKTQVQTIEKSAFSGCTGLTGVILPDTLEVLGAADGSSGSVFNGCSGRHPKIRGDHRQRGILQRTHLPDRDKTAGRRLGLELHRL